MFKLILLFMFVTCEAYKVLVIYSVPAKSHTYLGDGVVRHLLAAGHEVTYITHFPKARAQHPSLREIDISSLQTFTMDLKPILNIENQMNKSTPNIITFINMVFESHVSTLEHDNVRRLLSDPEETFDVVIADWMITDLYSGIAAVYNCPFIWASSTDPHWAILKNIDEIPNPAYNSDMSSYGAVPFSFAQRAVGLVKIVLGLGAQYFYLHRKEHKEYQRLLVPLIQKRGHEVPDFEELRHNVSLILGNSHVSLGSSIRLPQNYKDVGGFHVNTDIEPLSNDTKRLLDKAENGLIYFSMGSNLQSRDIPKEIKVDLMKIFGKLKQTIVWKFEEDLPKRPSNVHILQWAPQQHILAHPNCVLFISHGGLLSITETIHFGKPIIGIPVYGDQFSNVDRAVNKGFAKRVDLSYSMAAELENAIHDILNDPSYTNRAKTLSLIYHDRPVAPGTALVHWVEQVVRTGGAPHLRSPALLVPWHQRLYLDLALLAIVIVYSMKFFLRKLVCRMYTKKEQKTKTQ